MPALLELQHLTLPIASWSSWGLTFATHPSGGTHHCVYKLGLVLLFIASPWGKHCSRFLSHGGPMPMLLVFQSPWLEIRSRSLPQCLALRCDPYKGTENLTFLGVLHVPPFMASTSPQDLPAEGTCVVTAPERRHCSGFLALIYHSRDHSSLSSSSLWFLQHPPHQAPTAELCPWLQWRTPPCHLPNTAILTPPILPHGGLSACPQSHSLHASKGSFGPHRGRYQGFLPSLCQPSSPGWAQARLLLSAPFRRDALSTMNLKLSWSGGSHRSEGPEGGQLAIPSGWPANIFPGSHPFLKDALLGFVQWGFWWDCGHDAPGLLGYLTSVPGLSWVPQDASHHRRLWAVGQSVWRMLRMKRSTWGLPGGRGTSGS